MRNLFILLFSIFSYAIVFSQSEAQFGFLPKINTSIKLNKSIKWVNSIEVREIIYEDKFLFSHNLIDIASIISIKTSLNQSLNVGYIIRFREGEIIHRSLQHYNLVSKYDGFRIGQRLGFEQEYFLDKSPRFRTRYRINYEKPLNGNKIDLKEFYIKLGSEVLYNFTTENLELRALPYLGYQISKRNKLEFGIDARIGNVFTDNTSNKNWLRLTWYKNF